MSLCSVQLLHSTVIVFGSMTFGMVCVYPSPTANDIQKLHGLTETSIAWVFYNSISYLFGMLGAYLTEVILRAINGKRKLMVFIIDCFGAASWLLNCLTKPSIYSGIFSRALLGITIGAYMTLNPMYLVEMAPEGYQSVFGAMNQFGICIGDILCSVLGPYIDYMGLNYVGASICVLQAYLIWFIQESPEAGKENKDEKPISAVFKREYANNLAIGIVLLFVSQFSGINAILSNLSTIMVEGGLKMNPNFQSAIALASQFLAIVVNFLSIEKAGRKAIWIISSSICAIGLLLLALNEKFNWSNVLPVVCIFIYNFGYGLGIGPIPWFIVSELFEYDVRSAANSICILFNWAFAFVMVMVFPSMKKSMGMFGASLFFFGVCIFSIIFGIFEIPGRSTTQENPIGGIAASKEEQYNESQNDANPI